MEEQSCYSLSELKDYLLKDCTFGVGKKYYVDVRLQVYSTSEILFLDRKSVEVTFSSFEELYRVVKNLIQLLLEKRQNDFEQYRVDICRSEMSVYIEEYYMEEAAA